MLDDSTPLIIPSLGALYQTLAPWAEALLRAAVGLALVPHGLRNTFGMFPTTGVRAHSVTELAEQLDRDGYRPGKFWAPAISITQLVGGPLLALGLFTRPVVFVLSGVMAFAYFIAHAPRSFFPVLNAGDAAVLYCFVFLYFVFAGPGPWSLDAMMKRSREATA